MSDSLGPHVLWPTSLLCSRDCPCKSTGVGCHFFLQRSFQPRDWNLASFVSYMAGRFFIRWATTSFYFYFSKGKMWEKICFESRFFSTRKKERMWNEVFSESYNSENRAWKENNSWNVSLVHNPKRHRTINEVLSRGWSMRFKNHTSLWIFTLMVEYCNYPHFP